MIRDATRADMDRLVDMGTLFHAASTWASVSVFRPAAFRKTLERMIDEPGGILLISDGPREGMGGVVLYDAWFDDCTVVAQELFLWGNGDILPALEERAKRLGASLFMMGDQKTLRPNVLERWLSQRQYEAVETLYRRGL